MENTLSAFFWLGGYPADVSRVAPLLPTKAQLDGGTQGLQQGDVILVVLFPKKEKKEKYSKQNKYF